MHTNLALLSLVTLASASFSGNLNYRSPSHNHPSLGASPQKIAKRHVQTRQAPAEGLNFTHGVASGDPYPESVILWTRAAPQMDDDKSNVTVSGYAPMYNHETAPYVNMSKSPVCVDWKVGMDMALSNVVSKGRAYTSSEVDYTVKVEAGNLQPFTQYFYQFNVCGSNSTMSPIGRTKTSPAASDKLSELALAVFSCSNYPFGFFNAFGNSARKDAVDYVVHLGDYYYEYKNGDYGNGTSLGRVPQPDREIYTLYDYRRRLATYRTDLDLLLSHQQFAWIPVWDDHEVADNTFKDGSSQLNDTESSFVEDGGVSVDQRKMNAVRAYFEWMPIRQVDMDDNLRIWRNFKLGNLMDLIMLDTRQYDRSITDLSWNTDYVSEISNDAGRSVMGPVEEPWFFNQLTASAERGATWRVIGSQIVFSRMNESFSYGDDVPFDVDAWDGYRSSRNRTLHHLYSNGINNNIFLAGDSHMNWVSDIVWLNSTDPDMMMYDPATGAGSIGVEFAGTGVSSPSPLGEDVSMMDANNGSSHYVAANPELQWQEAYYRGYYEMRVSHKSVNATYFGTPTLLNRNPNEIPLANFSVAVGANKLTRPIANGIVESGALKDGMRMVTNITNDTSVAGGRWFISQADTEVL